MTIHFLVVRLLAVAVACVSLASHAQQAKVRFTLDWRYEAPAAPFILAHTKGYFAQEKVDVTIDSGGGSGMAVTRVASGTYEMGFADLAAVMEFQGNNPTAPQRPVGVMMIYNNTPAAMFALRKSGIKTPQDLEGRTLGAPAFDAARRSFPVFAKANRLEKPAQWTSMDPTLREVMLARGDVDAISGFTFYTPLSLVARGVKEEDIVTLPYADYGVRLYGNAVIANAAFAAKNPEVVKAVLRAVAKGYRDTIANPAEAARLLKQREPLVDEALELERLKYLVSRVLLIPSAKADGFGKVSPPRVSLMAAQLSDAYGTKTRIDGASAFDPSFLPSDADLDVFPR